MGLFEKIGEAFELHRVKKSAKKVTREESKRYDTLIDEARNDGDLGKILTYGVFKNTIRENGKRINKSKNPLEIDLRKTGTSAMSVAGRIAGNKVGKGFLKK